MLISSSLLLITVSVMLVSTLAIPTMWKASGNLSVHSWWSDVQILVMTNQIAQFIAWLCIINKSTSKTCNIRSCNKGCGAPWIPAFCYLMETVIHHSSNKKIQTFMVAVNQMTVTWSWHHCFRNVGSFYPCGRSGDETVVTLIFCRAWCEF